MPLLIMEKQGRACPTVVCDHCGQPIKDAKEGNYQWEVEGDGTLYFTHKQCCRAFEAARSRGLHWAWSDLSGLPVFLANNLKLKWKDAKETARWMASLG